MSGFHHRMATAADFNFINKLPKAPDISVINQHHHALLPNLTVAD